MAPGLIAVALGALALAAPATAAQTPIIDQAANSARERSVYVHPGTNLLTGAEARRLERQIEREANGPLYIAILPEAARREAGGTTTGVVLELNRRIITTNPPAVHAVVVGNQFRAVNRDIPAGDLATEAFEAHRADGVYAVLSDFVRRVGEARAAAAQPVQPPGGGDNGSNLWLVAVFAAIVALLGLGVFRRQRRRASDLGEVKATAKEDLVALADDVSELDAEVDRHPEAKEAYVRAIEAYQRADDAFDRARSPRDISKVTSALADSRFEMETAKALLADRPPPERRPPCFFDPRHGLSVRDVAWRSPQGATIKVPACAADAARVEAGETPETRQVLVGGERRPFWDSDRHEPWASGFFGGAAAGVFVGSVASEEADAASPVDDSSQVGGGDFGGDVGGGGDFGGDGGGGGDF
jgi:uncharacterized membrane protein YgcG